MSEQRRQSLIARRAEAQARLDGVRAELRDLLAASVNTNSDDEHDPEGATVGFERAQLATLERAGVQSLLELEEALARLADDTYGTCERCGREIGAERLQARPDARLCIECAQARR